MNIFVGHIKPKINKKCVVSGRVFGPDRPKKVGMVVQVKTDDGKFFSYPVFGKVEAEQIRENAQQYE